MHHHGNREPSAGCMSGNRLYPIYLNGRPITDPTTPTYTSAEYTPATSSSLYPPHYRNAHYSNAVSELLLGHTHEVNKYREFTSSASPPLSLPQLYRQPKWPISRPVSPTTRFLLKYKSAALCPCPSCVIGRTAEERGRLCSKVQPTRPPRPGEPVTGSSQGPNTAALASHKSTIQTSNSKVRIIPAGEIMLLVCWR